MSTQASNTGSNNSTTPNTEKGNWSLESENPSTSSTPTSMEVKHNSSSDGSSSPSKLRCSYTGLTFGQALEALKQGVKVRRSAWTGDAYCWIKPASIIEESWVRDPYLKEAITAFGFETPVSGKEEEGTGLGIVGLSTICLKSSDNHIITGWCPSVTEMLSDDWCICEVIQ